MLDASELSRRLAGHAEAVCRRYLSNGRREGAYWLVGDVANTRGGSLYVRLHGARVGRWRDAATGEGGDLLDLIAAAGRHGTLAETLAEARRFLALPQAAARAQEPWSPGSSEAARRLFAASRPIRGTLAEAYPTAAASQLACRGCCAAIPPAGTGRTNARRPNARLGRR